MPDPSPMERFGRALQGFGYGTMGRTPPFAEEDLTRERLAQQERQFGQTHGLAQQQLAEAQKVHAAQLEQIRSTIGLEGLKALPMLQNMIEGLPVERQEEAVKQWTPFVSRLFSFATQGNVEGQTLAAPGHVTELLRPGDYGKNFLKEYPFLADRPTDRAMVSKMVREGKYTEARTYLKEAAASVKETTLQTVYGKVRQTAGQFAAPIPFADAVKAAGLTQLEQTVMDEAVKDADPTKLDQLLVTMNIKPLGPIREQAGIPVAAEKAGAIKTAEGATPSGRAELARTQAQTAETQARTTEIQSGKVVPFQEGGGIAIVPPGAAQPTIIQPPGPKPVPMSPGERELLTKEAAGIQKFDDLAALYRPEFVGPARGRLGGLGETTGAISSPEAQFRAQVAGLKNELIQQMAGANVPPAEERRMLAQLPTEHDPSVVFEAKLRQSRSNLLKVARLRRDILAKTGADVSRLPPLPVDPRDPLGIR